MDVDNDEGYYYTGQAPFRKQNESKLHFHARRLISIQTLGRLEYTVEEAETKFNRALGPVELTFVGLGKRMHNNSADRTNTKNATTFSLLLLPFSIVHVPYSAFPIPPSSPVTNLTLPLAIFTPRIWASTCACVLSLCFLAFTTTVRSNIGITRIAYGPRHTP